MCVKSNGNKVVGCILPNVPFISITEANLLVYIAVSY